MTAVADANCDRSGRPLRPVRTTFVLPDRNRSGGVRVTVEMANRLLASGYDVRIVYRKRARSFAAAAKSRLDAAVRRLQGAVDDDWLPSFRGQHESYRDLRDLAFRDGEVVIAVGSLVVQEVYRLQADVVRVRFCHGFHHFLKDQMAQAWGMPMPTFTVSETLIPGLTRYAGGGEQPIWVVPNGISGDEYFDEQVPRDGVGTIYSPNTAKNPEDTVEIVRRIGGAIPEARRYVFGTTPRPAAIPRHVYSRLPPLDQARRLYNRSKVWLLMSQAEGLPGPPLEAMACGTVIVSTDNEGSREIIRHDENGLLFPVGDLDACLEQVRRVWRDEVLRRRLVQAGFETAKHFSWPRAVERMRVALQELLEASRNDGSGSQNG